MAAPKYSKNQPELVKSALFSAVIKIEKRILPEQTIPASEVLFNGPMAQDMEMTFGDSDFCAFYEFPSKAFPRFRYIQDNLISFYPRFKRIVETLPVCLKWKDLMEELTKKVEPLEKSTSEVILFGDKHSMIKAEQIVANINKLNKNEFKRGTISRKDLPPRVSVDTPQVLVYRCSSDQVQQEIILLEKELAVGRLDNVLLLIDVGGQSEHEGRVFLEEIISSLTETRREFWKDKMIVNTPDQDISTKISNHLEMRIRKEFERIDGCIGEFLSVRRKVESISSLKSDLVLVVKEFFQNKTVVQDLMNLAHQKEGSDQFLKKTVIWFVQREVSAELAATFKMAAGDMHAMLDELNFEEECKRKISPTTWLSIVSELSEVYMESLQSEDLMDTDSQTLEKMETDQEYPEHRKKSRNQHTSHLSVIRAKMLMKDLQPVLREVKRFLQGVQEGLRTLSHLQFELKGILEVPGITVPIEKWTKKLMNLQEVQGCGDHFGTLIVFISNQNNMVKEQEVKQKIAMCLTGCPYNYDIKISTKPREYANPNQSGAGSQMQHSYFKAGQKIRFLDKKGQARHGTLGIFLLGKKERSVYFVTNGHVVIGEGKVYISVKDESYEELGTEIWDYRNGFIDIAAVKVKSDMLSHCMFHCENYYGDQCSYVMLKTLEDTLDKLVGKKVFKRGAETGKRVGIISSKSIQMKEEGIIKTYNMVISPLPGSNPEEAEFAKEGDSGSVVCLYTAEENNIVIIAMIIGGLTLKPTLDEKVPSRSQGNQASEQNEEKLCFAFSLRDGVSKLNETHELDLDIET